LCAVFVLAALPIASARADVPEDAASLGEPRPGVRRARRTRPRPHEAPPEAPWEGARVELGYTHYSLADGAGGGKVHAATFGGYVPTGVLRLGGYAEGGSRQYELGGDDLLLRATVLAGYQHLGWRPFVPFIAAVATVGVVIGERFHTSVSSVVGGGGLEAGADLRLVRNLWAGLSLAYMRVGMQGLGFDLLVLRVRIGL
jgi:hypothetical protein